ncbi:MAG: T9SS type A sorting domain-containing protein [Candidatus Marinimicrobia bacterium]|nr:T9SS type A sorting domain-containing protein [Candidatus Neomarinimicrobiota bacterium]
MMKYTLLLTLTICAAASLSISQPAYAQISEFKLTASDNAAGDEFGRSASISGDYAVVGAEFDDDNGTDAGSAYVFKRSGTSWAQEAKLLASDGAAGDVFGFSVSISGDYAVVGAHDDGDHSGSAYLFKRTGTSWTEEAKLLASDGAAGDHFGVVSISGGYVVVGAYFDDDNGTDAGSAYLYTGFATPVGVESEIAGLPAEFALSQNYPNPFNPETVIEYALPQSGDVSLVVYNLNGEEVRRWDIQGQPAGNHNVTWNASNFASGVYLYRLQAGDFIETLKMILLK